MKKDGRMDKKRALRRSDHLTRPPRLEGEAKNAGINPVRKKGRLYKYVKL
jgi:hypothetical protein